MTYPLDKVILRVPEGNTHLISYLDLSSRFMSLLSLIAEDNNLNLTKMKNDRGLRGYLITPLIQNEQINQIWRTCLTKVVNYRDCVWFCLFLVSCPKVPQCVLPSKTMVIRLFPVALELCTSTGPSSICVYAGTFFDTVINKRKANVM